NTVTSYSALTTKDYAVPIGLLGEGLNPGIREPLPSRPSNDRLEKLGREVKNTVVRTCVNSIEHGIKPVAQLGHDCVVSTGYFVGNIFDRAYARAFHEYDRMRTLLAKK